MPRLRSATGPVMVAPRSAYVLPTVMCEGLSPLMEMTGAIAGVDVALLPEHDVDHGEADES
jgi:hypothetical protein